MTIPINDLLPKQEIEVKQLPPNSEQKMQHSTARPTKSVGLPKAVREQALAMIDNALAPEREKNVRITKAIKKGDLTVAATYEAFGIFEKAVGGREALLNVLRHLPHGTNGDHLIQRLVDDPDFLTVARNKKNEEVVRYALSVLCRRQRISLSALVAAFRDAKTAQLAIEALTQLAPHTPEVVEQIAEDATNRYAICPVCDGATRVNRIGEDGEWLLQDDGEPATQLCYECRGTGKVWKGHDIQNRKLFLQMTGLVSDKKSETTVNVGLQQAHILNGQFLPGDGSFERIVRAVNIQSAPTITIAEGDGIPNAIYEVAPNPNGSAPEGAS